MIDEQFKKQRSTIVACTIITFVVFLLVCIVIIIGFATAGGTSIRNVYNVTYDNETSWEQVAEDIGGNALEFYCAGNASVSSGSGFVLTFDDDGCAIAMTNFHVVEDLYASYSAQYTLYVKTMYESGTYTQTCQVLGYDEYHDVAIVKLNDVYKSDTFIDLMAEGTDYFATATIGEDVGAIGNAISEGLGMVSGIVSKNSTVIKYSESTRLAKCVPVIQTTAATNSGMSGSGLFNSNGQLIGINTYKADDKDDINYAVPIDIVLSIYDNVMSGDIDSDDAVNLLNIDSGNSTYKACVTEIQSGYYQFNAFGIASSTGESVTIHSNMGFSGVLLNGRGEDSAGLVGDSENVGLYVNSSNVSGLSAGQTITEINGRKLDGTYANLFSTMYDLQVVGQTDDGDAVSLVCSDGTTVEWTGIYKVVSR